ncbi:hypothetical protein D3C80_1230100 [compost metagenome]
MKNAGVTVQMAFAAHLGTLHCHAIAEPCAVADVCGVYPAVIADLCGMAYHTGLSDSGVALNFCPRVDDAILIVDPTGPVMRKGAFVIQPPALGSGGHIVKIAHGNNLPQRDGRFRLSVVRMIKSGFVAESVFFHRVISAGCLTKRSKLYDLRSTGNGIANPLN